MASASNVDESARAGVSCPADEAKKAREALRERFRAADQRIYENARRRKDGKHSDSASRV